jgi:hypothetical protein
MAAKQKHTGLYLAGGAAAALGGYQFVLKPWLAAKAAAAAGATGASAGLFPSLFPSVTAPINVGPSASAGGQYQSSIKDPRKDPGGPVGEAMARKNWTQQQATERLNAITAAARLAVQQIAALQANTVNPNSANVAQAQAALAANRAALANAQAQQAQNAQDGDALGATKWQAAAAAHAQDISELEARIRAALAPLDNSGAIAAYQGALANQRGDYFALTGVQLVI